MPGPEVASRLLIEDEPRPGAWNMAFDEALLEAAVRRGESALRIYRWSEPTLSLGYFQKTLPPDLPEGLRRLPAVRRLSGGGAILHDREWTYSCCVPKGHTLAAAPELLYDAVHGALIRGFARLGVAATRRGNGDREADGRFLCFLRGDARDLLVSGRKVVGSAQRRRRGAVLQHGSVLLGASPLAPELPGLFDLIPGTSAGPLFGSTEFVEEVAPALGLVAPLRRSEDADLDYARTRVVSYAAAGVRGEDYEPVAGEAAIDNLPDGL